MDMYQDFRDGNNLLLLLEILTDEKLVNMPVLAIFGFEYLLRCFLTSLVLFLFSQERKVN